MKIIQSIAMLLLLLCSTLINAQVPSTNGTFTATTPSNLSLLAGATPTARLTILNSSGFVGINNTAPSDWLHVSGSVRANQFNTTTGVLNTIGATTNMSFNINNTNRMTLLSGGNLGIGTATPADLLHINGIARANQLNLTGGTLNTIGATTNMSFNINNTNRMTLLSGGNLGIGTATPADLLHVNGIARANQLNLTGGTLNTIGATTNMSFNINGTNQMTLLSNGNLGIGTATPRGQLDVAGTGNIFLANDLVAGSSQTIFLPGHVYFAPYGGSNWTYLQARRGNDSGSTNFMFRTWNDGVQVEPMAILSNGNVGIGTTTPTYKLDVAGTINATNILVNGQPLTSVASQWLTSGTTINYPTGNVGIGITAPTEKLDINGNIKLNSGSLYWTWPNQTIEQFSPEAGSSVIRFRNSMSAGNGNPNGGFDFADHSGTSVMKITNYNVGIGITAPFAKLHIKGTLAEKGLYVETNNSWIGYSDGHNYFRGNTYLADTDVNSKVGIGTLTPAYKLDVAGTINATNILVNGQPISGGSSQWATNGSNISYAAGNVGIGTTAPGGKLHVNGSLYVGNNDGSAPYRVSIGGSYGDYGSIGYGYKYTDLGGHTYLATEWASQLKFDAGGFDFKGATIGTAGAPVNFSSLMKIINNGNVGIGTTAPDGLQINIPLASETAQAASNIRMGVLGATPRIVLDKAGSVPFEIDNAGGQLRIFNPGAVRFVVNTNGYVGIGTAAPDAALTVKGTIHTNEVKVDLNGAVAPDYVFEKDYHLMSLEETKAYIDANKHLPEVPSAKEMEKNGVQLGEMNLLLLKKVEELTLHLIEMKKENAELRNRVEKIENKN